MYIVSCSQCQSTSTCYQYQHDDKTVLVGEKRLLRTGICFIKAQIHRRQFISVSKFQYSQMIIVKWYPMSDNLQVQCACRKVTMKRGIYIPEHCKQFRNLDSTSRIEMMSSLQKISKQAGEMIYHSAPPPPGVFLSNTIIVASKQYFPSSVLFLVQGPM